MFGVTRPSGGRSRSQKTEPTEEGRSVPSLPIWKRGTVPLVPLFHMVRETGLEPVWINHTPLKRARLPVPPLSRRRYLLYRRVARLSRGSRAFSEVFCLSDVYERFPQKPPRSLGVPYIAFPKRVCYTTFNKIFVQERTGKCSACKVKRMHVPMDRRTLYSSGSRRRAGCAPDRARRRIT